MEEDMKKIRTIQLDRPYDVVYAIDLWPSMEGMKKMSAWDEGLYSLLKGLPVDLNHGRNAVIHGRRFVDLQNLMDAAASEVDSDPAEVLYSSQEEEGADPIPMVTFVTVTSRTEIICTRYRVQIDFGHEGSENRAAAVIESLLRHGAPWPARMWDIDGKEIFPKEFYEARAVAT